MTDGPGRGGLSVLHVVALVGSGGEFGGPVSVAEAQSRELVARGHRVVVTGLRRGQVRIPSGLTADQWRTFPARRVVPRSGMLGLTSAGFLRFVWHVARDVDIVHVHAGRDLVTLSTLLIAWWRKAAVVAQTHGMVAPRRHLRARLFDPIFLRLLRRAATVLYMTDSEHVDLRGQLGPSAHLRFLGNGLELPPPRTTPPPGEMPQVLFLARLHPVKGVTAFAEMAALLT
ncbi:MAG: glycosyltransferase, partial [Propionibacteriales bacterium]|nr:glycosyltransferase [Propionibacteriales bacterium]